MAEAGQKTSPAFRNFLAPWWPRHQMASVAGGREELGGIGIGGGLQVC